MSGMTIITNNVPRYVIEAYELTDAERKEFDYFNWEAIERGEESASFFRYKGQVYDLGEFDYGYGMPVDSPLRKWNGHLLDSFFSGIVVRYVNDCFDTVIVGRFYS
jgi:hypothetical protein